MYGIGTPLLRQRPQPTACAGQGEGGALSMAMALWRIALTPPRGSRRAQPRWLCGDGLFRVHSERALTVADPAAAALRLQQWLSLRGREPAALERLQLVPVVAAAQAMARNPVRSSAEATP